MENIIVKEIENMNDARYELSKIDCHPKGVEIMISKSVFLVLKIKNIDNRAANILKQEMLAKGGEVAVSSKALKLEKTKSDCIVMGTISQYRKLIETLKGQPFGLTLVRKEIEKIIFQKTEYQSLKIKDSSFPLDESPFFIGSIDPLLFKFEKKEERFIENTLNYSYRLREDKADIIEIKYRKNFKLKDYESIIEEEESGLDCPSYISIEEELENKDFKKVYEEIFEKYKNNLKVLAIKDSLKRKEVVFNLNLEDYPIIIVYPSIKKEDDLIFEILKSLEEEVTYLLNSNFPMDKVILDIGISSENDFNENKLILYASKSFLRFSLPIKAQIDDNLFFQDSSPFRRNEDMFSLLDIAYHNKIHFIASSYLKGAKNFVNRIKELKEENENL